MTIGPTCPVVQAGNPCADKPYQAFLTVLDTHGRKITRLQTDTNGYFHIALKPGEYVLHPESPAAMPNAKDQPFTVQTDQFTTVDIVYDSGIR